MRTTFGENNSALVRQPASTPQRARTPNGYTKIIPSLSPPGENSPIGDKHGDKWTHKWIKILGITPRISFPSFFPVFHRSANLNQPPPLYCVDRMFDRLALLLYHPVNQCFPPHANRMFSDYTPISAISSSFLSTSRGIHHEEHHLPPNPQALLQTTKKDILKRERK